MTLEELQALTDEQLIEKVATKVMGWMSFETYTGKRQCWAKPNTDATVFKDEWNPLADWNHTMEVVMHLHESTAFHLFSFKRSWWQAQFGDDHDGDAPVYILDQNPQRAICLAALLANAQ